MLERTDLTDLLGPPMRGKVRDVYTVGDQLVLVATDRISAFDKVLGLVPGKGQLLTAMAAWWFGELADVVPSHLVAVPDPAVTVGRRCTPLPVEVVMRGYLTGSTSTSVWTKYATGERVVYGVRLPDGLERDDPLPTPVLTPTTKAAAGQHDEPITAAEVVEGGLVDAARWAEVVDVAHELFRRGTEIAAAAGLTLVDTKYEMGIDDDGRLTLIDEVHTPDSSRWWRAGTHEHLDKEVVRLHYVADGYRGDGPPPPLPVDVAALAADRYRECYERLTGRPFELVPGPDHERIAANVAAWLDGR